MDSTGPQAKMGAQAHVQDLSSYEVLGAAPSRVPAPHYSLGRDSSPCDLPPEASPLPKVTFLPLPHLRLKPN